MKRSETPKQRLDRWVDQLNQWQWPRELGELPGITTDAGHRMGERDVIRAAFIVASSMQHAELRVERAKKRRPAAERKLRMRPA